MAADVGSDRGVETDDDDDGDDDDDEDCEGEGGAGGDGRLTSSDAGGDHDRQHNNHCLDHDTHADRHLVLRNGGDDEQHLGMESVYETKLLRDGDRRDPVSEKTTTLHLSSSFDQVHW